MAFSATVASIVLEGNNLIVVPEATGQGVGVFCLAENCIFGWMSKKWLITMLLFGLWVGMVCITGFNYAVSYAHIV